MPLNNFITYWHEDNDTEFALDEESLVRYGDAVATSLHRQYNHPGEEEGEVRPLRVSSLGKPVVYQAMHALGYDDLLPAKKPGKLRYIFGNGDYFEEQILVVLKSLGYKVTQEQAEIDFRGIKGHIDAVIEDTDGTKYVLEIKTMSPRYYSSFKKVQDDDRGYATQLSVYSEALGLPGVWLCLDKSSSNCAVLPLQDATKQGAIERLDAILEPLRNIKELTDIFEIADAPPGVPEIYKKKPTGRLLLHPTVKFWEWRSVFYELVTDKNGYRKETEYVVRHRTPPEARAELDRLLKTLQ